MSVTGFQSAAVVATGECWVGGAPVAVVPVETEPPPPQAASIGPTSTAMSGAAIRVAAPIRLFRMSIVPSSSRRRSAPTRSSRPNSSLSRSLKPTGRPPHRGWPPGPAPPRGLLCNHGYMLRGVGVLRAATGSAWPTLAGLGALLVDISLY